MNPSKRDIEALKLFYDINDNEEANKLLLDGNWENTDNDIVECIYDGKNAVFDKNDITASFFPGCEPVYTVNIKFNNNKYKLIPFKRIDEDNLIINLFTIK